MNNVEALVAGIGILVVFSVWVAFIGWIVDGTISRARNRRGR